MRQPSVDVTIAPTLPGQQSMLTPEVDNLSTAAVVPTAEQTASAGETPSGQSNSENGSSVDGQVLNTEQQVRLNEAALSYVSLTQEEATATAESLGYIRYASPSNMCGPLALAILRDAGIVDPSIDLRDFWLLVPDQQPLVIERTLPADQFTHYRFTTPINTFDFKAFPLQAGDLLYLYAGENGTFEHILTVSRVDEVGRAYAVNNMNTAKAGYYIIDEVMLYDPQQPGEGKFYEWTDIKNMWIGLTGYGGFDVWRLSNPLRDPTSGEKQMISDITAILQQSGGDWQTLIKEITGDRILYQHRAYYRVNIGTGIQLPIGMLVFAKLEQNGVADGMAAKTIREELYNGRTLAEWLHAMYADSDDTAVVTLLQYLFEPGFGPNAQLREWGYTNTDLRRRESTVAELERMLNDLMQRTGVSAEASQILLEEMANHASKEENGMGVITPYLPEKASFYSSRISSSQGLSVEGEAAIIDLACDGVKQTYSVVIMGNPGESRVTSAALQKAIEDISMKSLQSFICQ